MFNGHTHYYLIGDTCVRNVTVIRTIIRLPEALSFIAMVVMGVQTIILLSGYYVG